ncbi:MAG: DUF6488 family protein [Ghiorsea sp.]
MQIKTIILTIALMASPLTALAGGSHGHGHSHGTPAASITQSEAIEIAKHQVTVLVEASKVEKSWSPAIVESAEQKTYGHEPEWVVTFKNSKVLDPAKSTLYIFLSAKGKYIAANFTGK